MPVTPYHFGPSSFVALIFRKWIDPPVFVLANVVVDVEVLIIAVFDLGWPVHRYAHTLLLGALVGLLWGVAAWPLRHLFGPVMRTLRIPYRTTRWKMVLSGVLGVWLHVLVDAPYHMDVRIFWPNRMSVWWKVQHRLGHKQIESACLLFFAAALIPYAFAVVSFYKDKKHRAQLAALQEDALETAG